MQSALRIDNKKPKVMFKTQRLQACRESCRDISSDANQSRETPSLGIMEKAKERPFLRTLAHLNPKE